MSRKNMSLTKFGIDDGPHNMDGLRLLARDGYSEGPEERKWRARTVIPR